jgi:hypothetical protein
MYLDLDLMLAEQNTEMLDEAGGIVSFLARAYTGKDKDLPSEIDKELLTIKTEEQRKKLLDEIDNFIHEATATGLSNGNTDTITFPKDLELKHGEHAAPGSELFKKRLDHVHSQAGGVSGILKTSFKRAATQAGTTIFAAGLPGVISGTLLTLINAKDGTLTKYINELKAVRVKVASYKIPKKINEETLIELGLELDVLEEAGGIVSWIKRMFTGMDNSVISELQYDIANIKTSRDKYEAIQFINKLIKDAQSIIERGNFSHVGFGSLSVLFTFYGFSMGATSNTILSRLAAIPAEEGGAQLVMVKSAASGIGNVGVAIGVFAVIRLAANIMTWLAKNNGSIYDYLDSLVKLKAEVEAIHI